MNRSVMTLALGALIAAVASLPAEEPHLEFVRGLRARRYNDLAMEYLQKIAKDPSPELARELPLELARTRLELAKEEPDLGRRGELYAQARTDLEQVLKDNPGKENEARLEIAQVAVLQGKVQLSKAERADTPAARRGELKHARGILADAGKQLEAAAGRLSAQLEQLAEPKTPQEQAAKRALEQTLLQADFQRGLNFLDQATTISGDGSIKTLEQRGALVKQAEEVLKKVADFDTKDPLCWQAAAWVGRCYHEGGDPRKARVRYENILGLKEPPAAEAGKRLALYFLMLVLPDAAQGKENPVAEQLKAGNDWLTRYRPYVNTPEGLGVVFLLAEIYYKQANEAKDGKVKAQLYDRAKELYRQLEETENDYSDRAGDRKMHITFIAQGGPTGDVKKFQTFEDCFVRSRFEFYKLTLDPKEIKDPKDLAKKRKERLDTIAAALNRGLELVRAGKGGKVNERDLLNASAMLTFAHLRAGDYDNAIQVAEGLIRNKPQSSQAPNAAVYALEAYVHLLGDADLAEDKQQQYRKGMDRLVTDIKKQWPDEAVADHARHQLGVLLIREKKFPEAVAELATVRPAYANIIQARWQLAAAALQAEQDKATPVGPDKRPFKEQALAALEGIPELPANADGLTAHIYVSAKIQLGQQYYELKKFKEMEALAQPLLELLPKMALENDEVRGQLRTGLNSLILYARYGRAEADYGAGRYAEVRKVLDPVIDSAKAGKLPELKAIPQLRWALLGLALRANVLDSNMKRAQEVIGVLQSYSDDKDGPGKAEAVLQPIIKLMSDQIEELRRKDQKEQLDKTLKSFSDFLDLLKQQQKNPTPEFLYVLGQSYINLGKYAEAVGLLEKVPVPAEADDKAVRLHRAARLLHVRALRQSGQLDKAEEALKAIMAEGWGKQNVEALKEDGHMLDAREKFGLAAQHWNSLLKTVQNRIQTDAAAKEQYFEVYFYLTRSYCRLGVTHADRAKGEKYVRAAAGFISKLEAQWPDLGGEVSKARFMELLEKEPALKKEYDQIKAEKK